MDIKLDFENPLRVSMQTSVTFQIVIISLVIGRSLDQILAA